MNSCLSDAQLCYGWIRLFEILVCLMILLMTLDLNFRSYYWNFCKMNFDRRKVCPWILIFNLLLLVSRLSSVSFTDIALLMGSSIGAVLVISLACTSVHQIFSRISLQNWYHWISIAFARGGGLFLHCTFRSLSLDLLSIALYRGMELLFLLSLYHQ